MITCLMLCSSLGVCLGRSTIQRKNSQKTSSRRMAFLSCVVLSLIILIADGFNLHCEQEIKAEVGKDVLITCEFGGDIGGDHFVIWQRSDDLIVHKIKHGKDQINDQHANYTERTEISINKEGITLTLKKVRVWDDGIYKLSISTDKGLGDTSVTLLVWAIPTKDLVITLNPDKSDGLKLTCSSQGWYPEPIVFWKDKFGNDLKDSEIKTLEQDSKGLYRVEHNVKTVPDYKVHYICHFKSEVMKRRVSMSGVISDGRTIFLEDKRADL
uniref:CD276 antigen-like n=1 Tax=Callorhinchus milii TaxID=7868 RepID=A0A4W3GFK0_CALMI